MLEIIARVARNGHFTIPSKIRNFLHLEDGDIVRIGVKGNQMIITPAAVVDKDQEYFFTEECQKEVKLSEKNFKKGKHSSYTSAQDLKKEIEGD